MASPSVSPSGTNYPSVTIAGAWRQKDVGSAKRCVRWTRGIYGGPGDIRSQAYAIVGSNDQTTWYLVDRVSNQHTNSINRTVNASYSQYSYRYYRWIEEQMESSASYILSHWFGMFDENNAQLTTDGSFTSSNGAGDVGGNSSGAFTIDSANGTNGTFNWQQTSNYGSGTYSGPTTTLVYDPTQSTSPAPVLGNYWSFTMASSSQIGSYGLGTYDSNMTIYGWSLLGSNNEATWDVIDTRTSTVGYNSANTTNFTLSTPSAAYSFIRLVITAAHNNNGNDWWFYRGGFWLKNQAGAFLTSTYGITSSEFANPYGTPYLATTANTGSVGPNLYAGYNSNGYLSSSALNTLYSGSGYTYTGTVSSIIAGPNDPVASQVYGNYWSFTMNFSSQIGSYGLGTYDPNMTINGWYLLGSNNNALWDVIDNKTSTVGYNSANTTNFTLSNPSNAYSYIRLVITAAHNNNGGDWWFYRGGFWLKNPSGTFLTSSTGSTSSEFANPYGTPYLATTAYTGSVGPNIYAGYNWSGYLNASALNALYSGSGYSYTGTRFSLAFLPPSPPPAPASLSASAGNQSVSISFTQSSNGGAAITNYKYSLDGGATFTAFSPAVTTSPVSITGLTNGVSYSIKLKAVNSLGDGADSASITVTPATNPDAPTDLVASYAGSGAVEISFTPGNDEGAAITNYQYSLDCGATFTPLSPVDGITPVTITGLTNGQSYCIELKAVNSIGAGVASSSVQYAAYGPADAPTNITWVDTLNGTISASFISGSDQGSSITNYEYSLDGGTTFTPFNPPQYNSPVSISGLNIRTHYSLVLRAVNGAGVGQNSETLNMYYMCFLEGTKILCFNPETNQEEYRAIETLRKGSLVKTVDDGYKRIDMIGTSKIYNPGNSVRSKNRLYKCSKENYPSLTEDLFITGCHSILVKDISEEERAELMDYQGKIYITDNHYRLIAAVDKRAEPHASEGVFNIWHMALENDNYYFNYGIYANGLLVETSSLRMMKEFSGMDLVQ
jgi:hypothetical protein